MTMNNFFKTFFYLTYNKTIGGFNIFTKYDYDDYYHHLNFLKAIHIYRPELYWN